MGFGFILGFCFALHWHIISCIMIGCMACREWLTLCGICVICFIALLCAYFKLFGMIYAYFALLSRDYSRTCFRHLCYPFIPWFLMIRLWAPLGLRGWGSGSELMVLGVLGRLGVCVHVGLMIMVDLDRCIFFGVLSRNYRLFWLSVCYSCLVLGIRFYLGLWRLSLRECTYIRSRYIYIYIYRYVYIVVCMYLGTYGSKATG